MTPHFARSGIFAVIALRAQGAKLSEWRVSAEAIGGCGDYGYDGNYAYGENYEYNGGCDHCGSGNYGGDTDVGGTDARDWRSAVLSVMMPI